MTKDPINMKSERKEADSAAALPRAPSRLEVKPLRGAPGWFLDGQPYVPILAQAGRGGLCEIRGGRLWLKAGLRVRTPVPAGLGASFAVACTLA